MRTRVLAAILGGVLLVAGLLFMLPGVKGSHLSSGSAVRKPCNDTVAGNFDSDDVDDLVIGVPDEDVVSEDDEDTEISNAGAIHVVYEGGASDQFITQETSEIESSEPNDGFGACLVAGDFNGDGHSDLAIGIPGEGRAGGARAGAVNVIYGSDDGLDPEAEPEAQIIDQNSIIGGKPVPGYNEPGDEFGTSLIAADFDGDDIDDLAIGAPLEAIGKREDAGALTLLLGSDDGVTAVGAQQWFQNSSGVQGVSEANDRFGQSLAAGDIDGDDHADLVIGVPLEAIGAKKAAGAINILYGADKGLTANNDDLLFQDTEKIAEISAANDRFGEAVAVGDYDDDGHADVAVGVPGEESVSGKSNDGLIHVFPGNENGTTTADYTINGADIWISQTALDPEDPDEDEEDAAEDAVADGDALGSVLNSNDFDDDGVVDLLAGVPHRDEDEDNQGAVYFIPGSDGSLFPEFSEYVLQDDVASGAGDENDGFGASIVSGDFEGDGGAADAAIGVPNEVVGTLKGAGEVDVAFDAIAPGAEYTQDDLDDDEAEANDHFGGSLG